MAALRLALRMLWRTPFVTGVAVLSLALGIGANSAIFSLFNQVLLKPLPVQAPGALVNLSAPGPKPGQQQCGQAGDCSTVFSYPMFRDLEKAQTAFTGLAAHRGLGTNLSYRGRTLNAEGALVSGSYFPVLGLRPVLGRLLEPEDDRVPGSHFVVVLSHAYWRTHFNQDPNVLNERLVVNGQPMTIVGVAPAGFSGTTLGDDPKVFVPLSMRELLVPGWKGLENRRSYWVYLFARLRPGMSLEQARASINVPYRAIINEVEAPLQRGMSDQTMRRFRAKQVEIEPGARGQSTVRRDARASLILLFSVTGVVLLIACANIANLLLARAAGRASEMAVRLSIGAGRGHLIRQLLVESCLLAMFGGVAGLLVARWTLTGIAAILPADSAISMELDRDAVLFAGAVSLATGFVFGLFPALHSTRPDLVSTLKGTTGQPSGARAAARFRTALATAQIALSMALLVAAGLFTKSLMNVSRVDLGLRSEKLVVFAVSPDLNGYNEEQTRALFERMEEELAAIPGVTAVTASIVPLLAGSSWGNDVRVQGFESGPDVDSNSRFNSVGPGYFRTLGIPLVAGREFTRADGLSAPKVAIVNEAFARKFKLGRDVVGKRMKQSGTPGEELDIEIVGLARDAKYNDVKREVPPIYVIPYRQDRDVGFTNFYVRTTLDERQLLTTIPALVKRLDPNLPVEELKTMELQVKENMFMDRLISVLSAAFAVLATLLASVGLYGVLAYMVAQRTREFGVRMALGADSGCVRGLVLGQVGRMTVAGGIVGLCGALGVGRLAESLLFELKGHDPGVLVMAVACLTLVALAAGFIPAYRASRLDPMRALRYE